MYPVVFEINACVLMLLFVIIRGLSSGKRKHILCEEDNEMKKTIRSVTASILALMLCVGILAGCGEKEEPVAELPEEVEEYYDDEDFEELKNALDDIEMNL